MGVGPHLGVGNAYFLMRCLSAAFRLLLFPLKLPVATRLPSAMSSLPKGSGRMELAEVKLQGIFDRKER